MMLCAEESYELVLEFLPASISSILNNKLESMTLDEIFRWNNIGHMLKWYQPSVLEKLARHLECTHNYKEYMKKLKVYCERRSSIRNNDQDSDICITVDREWSAEIFSQNFNTALDVVLLLKNIVRAHGKDLGKSFRIKCVGEARGGTNIYTVCNTKEDKELERDRPSCQYSTATEKKVNIQLSQH